jgi:hypothetical protein
VQWVTFVYLQNENPRFSARGGERFQSNWSRLADAGEHWMYSFQDVNTDIHVCMHFIFFKYVGVEYANNLQMKWLNQISCCRTKSEECPPII